MRNVSHIRVAVSRKSPLTYVPLNRARDAVAAHAVGEIVAGCDFVSFGCLGRGLKRLVFGRLVEDFRGGSRAQGAVLRRQTELDTEAGCTEWAIAALSA